MEQQFKTAIFQTLAFFDIFEHPLTCQELYRMLLTYGFPDPPAIACGSGRWRAGNPDLSRQGGTPPYGGGGYSYADFIIQLEHQVSLPGPSIRRVNSAERSQGFYFLPGRSEIVATRQRRVKIVEEKMRIAVRGIKKLRWVPFVRAVFICNTVAMASADEAGDIDVFIIVKKGRIWLARLSATLILSLFRLRRTKKKIKNRICLSFYVTDDNLNLEPIALKQPDLSGAALAKPDVYLIYWIANLIPVYDPDNLHQSVLNANKWVEKYLPNGLQEYVGANCCSSTQGAYGNTPVQLIKKMFEKIWGGRYGDMLETQARGIQQAKMKMNFQSRQNQPGTSVIISDSMLKFHEKDRREEYRHKWEEKCRKYLISPPALPCKAWRAGNI